MSDEECKCQDYDNEKEDKRSDTPECDDEAFVATYDYWESCDVVKLVFAERLERERNEARKAAEHYRNLYYLPKDGLAVAKNHALSWENAGGMARELSAQDSESPTKQNG
jgi:hypothetical protein